MMRKEVAKEVVFYKTNYWIVPAKSPRKCRWIEPRSGMRRKRRDDKNLEKLCYVKTAVLKLSETYVQSPLS